MSSLDDWKKQEDAAYAIAGIGPEIDPRKVPAPKESELERAVSRLSIKCDAIETLNMRPNKTQMNALIFLARKVVIEYYATQRVAPNE